jgi:hypothetical protein
MPQYRVYVLNEISQLTAAVNFDCGDDDEAIEHAKRLGDSHEVELWRLLAQVKIDKAGQTQAAMTAASPGSAKRESGRELQYADQMRDTGRASLRGTVVEARR